MKHTLTFLLVAVLCLSGCTEMEDLTIDPNQFDIQSLSNLSCYPIKIQPAHTNTIGKRGGDFVVTACIDETINPNTKLPNVLKNEFFTESLNLDASFVEFKGREQVNEQTVRYTFHFKENLSGQERGIGTRVMDTTFLFNGIHAALGGFSIIQLAE